MGRYDIANSVMMVAIVVLFVIAIMFATNTLTRSKESFQNFIPPYEKYTDDTTAKCLPGETFDPKEDVCVEDVCPNGMERGFGAGSDYCYPKCAPGYESDGGTRCYKMCPDGYRPYGEQCVRDEHRFVRDAVMCRGCTSDNPVVIPTVLPVPNIIDNRYTNYGIEQFRGDGGGTDVGTVNMQDKSNWRVQDKIFINEPPCPEGYRLSETDKMCYQQCPIGYNEECLTCIRPEHRTVRPYYDRGNGIPVVSNDSTHPFVQLPSGCRS